MSIDWDELGENLFASRSFFVVSSKHAQDVINATLGPVEMVAAVHASIASGPGSELARQFLSLLQPRAAMQECYRLFHESSDLGERRLAVALLKSIADCTALQWLDDFFDDPDEEIQAWAAEVLLAMAYQECANEEEVEKWVHLCEHSSNEGIKETAAIIREHYRS